MVNITRNQIYLFDFVNLLNSSYFIITTPNAYVFIKKCIINTCAFLYFPIIVIKDIILWIEIKIYIVVTHNK